MINEFLSDVLYILFSAALILLIKYVVPYVKMQLKNSKYEWIASTVMDCVQFAEQTVKAPKSGNDKKEIVFSLVSDWAKSEGMDISGEQINALIESAVYNMKQEQNSAS